MAAPTIPRGLAALTSGEVTRAGFASGTHRIVDPAATLARWVPEMLRFGITRLAELTQLDVIGIPVVQAVRPNGKSMSVAQGKGATVEAASASALMEAIETWHAEHLPFAAPCTTAALDGPRIDAGRLPRLHDAPFDDARPRTWLRGVDLVSGEGRWVPREVIDLDTTVRRPAPLEFATSSVGLSCGNVIDEAVAHGLYEVIERDAWSLHEPAVLGGDARRIDASTITDPLLVDLLERIDRAGVVVCLFDATSDVGIATVACMLFDGRPNPFRMQPVSFGLGCHPSPTIALSRAITESAQSRLTGIAGSRDDLGTHDYDLRRRSDEVAELRAALAALPHTVEFADLPDQTTGSITGDLRAALERLVAAGLHEAVAVDLTRTDVGLPVVKVLVPGCEDWDTGAVPGRRRAARIGAGT